MTCKEKLMLDHPKWTMKDVSDIMAIECPDVFGYLPDPCFCTGDSPDCLRCWDREIPDPIKPTEAKTDDTSDARSLVEEIDILKKTIEEQRIELIRCNAIVRTVEQFTGTRLPKIKTEF